MPWNKGRLSFQLKKRKSLTDLPE